MPQVTPTGCMASNVENFRVLIASTAAMQNWAGVSSQTECLDYVQTYRVRKGNIKSPMVVVTEDSFRYGRSAYIQNVQMLVLFVAEIPTSLLEDDPSPQIEFMNNRDAVIKETIESGETNDYRLVFDPNNACEPIGQIDHYAKTDSQNVFEQWVRFTYGIR